MPIEVTHELAKLGLMGMLLSVAGWVIYKLYLALNEAKDGRLADAKAYQSEILEVTRSVTAVAAAAVHSQNATKETLEELQKAFDEYAETKQRTARR